ncbi:helix-turn-helix transcriptional regulator [Sorangium sp. So ce1151]|uniref:helix-turn-helix transcriptional regulator n=1 Tax=Sorangium sp. So ce1151 TaxID=3133332 RepID=UPI003F6343C7
MFYRLWASQAAPLPRGDAGDVVGQQKAEIRLAPHGIAHVEEEKLMEDMLTAMWLVSPVVLAMMACVAIGFAATAREAMGRERGLREAREEAHRDEESALTEAKERAERERDRYRRLVDCHVDALVAATTDVHVRPVPRPGRILEAFCATVPGWQRKLGDHTGLAPRDVERLLTSDLPITPGLAAQLEAFTATPARYWERLWRLHDDHRTDADDTVRIQLGEPITRRLASAGPAALPASISIPPRPPAIPSRALDVPPPVVLSPELVAGSPRARLPPPPQPRLRSPLPARAGTGVELARRAATLTSFPLQDEDDGGSSHARRADWEDVERSPLNTTLPGVGRDGAA